MDDFSTPGVSNFWGLAPSPANFVEPGKRPQSSMSPTVVVDSDGDVEMVIGASGGSKIITAVALVSDKSSAEKASDSCRHYDRNSFHGHCKTVAACSITLRNGAFI